MGDLRGGEGASPFCNTPGAACQAPASPCQPARPRYNEGFEGRGSRGRKSVMGMQCAITGKKPVKGRQYARRGKAKYLGGVGKKVTGKSTRRFKPNLQRIKIVVNGQV